MPSLHFSAPNAAVGVPGAFDLLRRLWPVDCRRDRSIGGVMAAKRVHPPERGFRLGRLLGIDVELDWSLLIIFALITFNLGAGLFPSWHPDWGPALNWATAL